MDYHFEKAKRKAESLIAEGKRDVRGLAVGLVMAGITAGMVVQVLCMLGFKLSDVIDALPWAPGIKGVKWARIFKGGHSSTVVFINKGRSDDDEVTAWPERE